jgi:hypothetical protein
MSNTYIEDLAVHPTNSSTVFATIKRKKGREYCLAKTANAGDAWDYLADSPSPLKAVEIYTQNPSIIWVGDGFHVDNSFYVYKSSDSGQSWTEKMFFYFISGFDWTGVADILIKPGDQDSILVASDHYVVDENSFGEGVLTRTTNGGGTWEKLGLSTTALAADPNNPNVIYRGTRRIGQVFRYTDIWGYFTAEEITPAGGIGDIRDIEVDSDTKVYVAASDGLWRWDDPAWEKLPGLPTDDVTALTIDRSARPETVYAGTGEHGVFVAQIGDASWTPFNHGLGNLSITKLVVSDSRPKILYAGTKYGGVWGRRILDAGDINGDDSIGLDDVVAALQVTAGIEPNTRVDTGADVNGNGKIDLAEAIYILQNISEQM